MAFVLQITRSASVNWALRVRNVSIPAVDLKAVDARHAYRAGNRDGAFLYACERVAVQVVFAVGVGSTQDPQQVIRRVVNHARGRFGHSKRGDGCRGPRLHCQTVRSAHQQEQCDYRCWLVHCLLMFPVPLCGKIEVFGFRSNHQERI